MAFNATLTRNQANAENGATGYEITLGSMAWHIELHELAALFEDKRSAVKEVLAMRVGESKNVCLKAQIRLENKEETHGPHP